MQAARGAPRAALTHAVTEEEISKNVASLVKVPKPRRRRIKPWSVVEGGRFLADSVAREDPLFAAWVLVLCLGLRRGEVLGLTWKSIDFETGELYVDHQIQRAGRQVLHRETRTEESDDFLPLPAFCLKALRMRRAQQIGDRKAAGELWQDARGLVFTTKYGTPIEPGNLTRMFALRARRPTSRPSSARRSWSGSPLVTSAPSSRRRRSPASAAHRARTRSGRSTGGAAAPSGGAARSSPLTGRCASCW